MIAIAPDAIDPVALLSQFKDSASGAGAVVSFTGLVRSENDHCRLWLDHHERLTIAAIRAVADEARGRFGLTALAAVHRVGDVGPGEPIVFIAAAARHRRQAFDAVDFTIDQLKCKVPLWKRETRGGASRWVEPRDQDHVDAARWEGCGG